MIQTILKFLLRENKIIYNLHRWCHPSINGCTNEIIFRKIDLANYDNSYGLK